MMIDKLISKAVASENFAKDYETAADSEATYDRGLSEHTTAVVTALRNRAAYIRARLDV